MSAKTTYDAMKKAIRDVEVYSDINGSSKGREVVADLLLQASRMNQLIGETESQKWRVAAICNAYESGFGHHDRNLPNPYRAESDESLAYAYGKEIGAERAAAKDVE